VTAAWQGSSSGLVDPDVDPVLLQRTLYESGNPTRRWLHRSRRRWISETIFRLGPGAERAIELGPGSGVYLPALARVAETVVAVDIEDVYLASLDTLQRRLPKVHLVRGDLTRSAFPDACFDLVLCSEVIEHLPESSPALGEMRRLLRPGGVLILSTPQRYSPLEMFSKVALHPRMIGMTRRVYREPVVRTGHINPMTRRALHRHLDRAGLVIRESHAAGVYLPLAAEAFGEQALRVEQALDKRLRGSRLEWLLWTQFVVATTC
jgi:ubiquinone/menaquinone biosynthesis C-methylase UbiE